ncbi:Phosphatidylinositol transfer protein SEC14 [Abeliophyllum distichum]|uniref:Phosphatidylinositol transfer protein SEC14 n=1 Tax=Abeliophyllum distichum TaxID=126358 RepID=A0ABD1QYW9_9LAMI
MAEETKKYVHEVVAGIEEVVVTDVPEVEKEVPSQLEAMCDIEKAKKSMAEEVFEDGAVEDNKIIELALFKEESNKVDDLIDPQKKALDEFILFIQDGEGASQLK